LFSLPFIALLLSRLLPIPSFLSIFHQYSSVSIYIQTEHKVRVSYGTYKCIPLFFVVLLIPPFSALFRLSLLSVIVLFLLLILQHFFNVTVRYICEMVSVYNLVWPASSVVAPIISKHRVHFALNHTVPDSDFIPESQGKE
jgi:hypothetical protein